MIKSDIVLDDSVFFGLFHTEKSGVFFIKTRFWWIYCFEYTFAYEMVALSHAK